MRTESKEKTFTCFPPPAGEFWLFISCLTYIPVLYLPFYDMGNSRKESANGEEPPALEMHELQVRFMGEMQVR